MAENPPVFYQYTGPSTALMLPTTAGSEEQPREIMLHDGMTVALPSSVDVTALVELKRLVPLPQDSALASGDASTATRPAATRSRRES